MFSRTETGDRHWLQWVNRLVKIILLFYYAFNDALNYKLNISYLPFAMAGAKRAIKRPAKNFILVIYAVLIWFGIV